MFTKCIHSPYNFITTTCYDVYAFDDRTSAAPDVRAATYKLYGRSTMSDKTYSPKVLAEEIGVDAKVLRNYLRKHHTRLAEAKGTTWVIDEAAAQASREHFAKNRTDSAKAAEAATE